MNRLTYSLRRSLLMRLFSLISRRVNLSFDGSRSLSETKLGFLISTDCVVAEWRLAAASCKPSLMVTGALFLGYWRISLSIIV